MSGPALTPLANIATAPKGVAPPRSDGAATSGADAADTGFSRELQRHIDRDTKPSTEASGATPASAGKATDEKRTDGKSATDADTAREGTAVSDGQVTAPDVAALLGNLPPSGPKDSSTRQDDEDSALLSGLPPESQPAPADAALAALLAAGQHPAATATATGTVRLADERTEGIADGTAPGNGAGGRPPGATGLALADSITNRQAPTDAAPGRAAPEAALTDATAKLAASGESGGKLPDLGTEGTPANTFAGLHAAALANLRGEAPASATSPVPLHVATPAGSPGWPEEVGSRVSWMVGHEESHAQLTLTPPQLGKIEVSITVSGDQTSAQFVAATPAARELIEQSLPRLREVLEQSGINLGQTDVGTSSQSNDPGNGQRNNAWSGQRGTDNGAAPRVSAPQWIRRGDGLVDTFA